MAGDFKLWFFAEIVKTLSTMKIDDVISALNNVSLEDTRKCEDSVFTAIEMSLTSFLITNRSPIYVFTDALPNDEDEFETIFHLNTYWRAPVIITLTGF